MKQLLVLLPALAGLAGTCALLGSLLDHRAELRLLPGSIEAQKFLQFRTNADEYDLVYVGTSRVHRGFAPSVFDERMAGLGRPVRSYNFGLVGLGFLEESYLIEWILAQEPRRLRWLLIDPIHLDTVFQRANLFTQRDVAWHTPALALRGIRAAWSSARSFGEKLELTRLHLLHAAQRFCNVGVGANLLGGAWSRGERGEVSADGFGGQDEKSNPTREPESRTNDGVEPVRPSPLLWLTLRDCRRRARAAGVRPFIVLPPAHKVLDAFRSAHENGALPSLLSYSEREFPEVFARPEDTFYSEGHLNRVGAALFSKRLAEDLLPLLDAGQ